MHPQAVLEQDSGRGLPPAPGKRAVDGSVAPLRLLLAAEGQNHHQQIDDLPMAADPDPSFFTQIHHRLTVGFRLKRLIDPLLLLKLLAQTLDPAPNRSGASRIPQVEPLIAQGLGIDHPVLGHSLDLIPQPSLVGVQVPSSPIRLAMLVSNLLHRQVPILAHRLTVDPEPTRYLGDRPPLGE